MLLCNEVVDVDRGGEEGGGGGGGCWYFGGGGGVAKRHFLSGSLFYLSVSHMIN